MWISSGYNFTVWSADVFEKEKRKRADKKIIKGISVHNKGDSLWFGGVFVKFSTIKDWDSTAFYPLSAFT